MNRIKLYTLQDLTSDLSRLDESRVYFVIHQCQNNISFPKINSDRVRGFWEICICIEDRPIEYMNTDFCSKKFASLSLKFVDGEYIYGLFDLETDAGWKYFDSEEDLLKAKVKYRNPINNDITAATQCNEKLIVSEFIKFNENNDNPSEYVECSQDKYGRNTWKYFKYVEDNHWQAIHYATLLDFIKAVQINTQKKDSDDKKLKLIMTTQELKLSQHKNHCECNKLYKILLGRLCKND